jgi:CRP-like cAMP-binding protein
MTDEYRPGERERVNRWYRLFMAGLEEVKGHGVRLFGRGEPLRALRLYDAVVAAAPLDFESRLKVADCLVALGETHAAAAVYRAVAWYALESGHPLTAVVAARVLETLAAEFEDILAALVVRYGNESELIGKFAARINVPPPDTPVDPPDLGAPPPVDFVHRAGERAATCTSDFHEYPAAVHPIPLLSELSEDAFRRVLGTLVVRRLPHGQLLVRQGEPGSSFFFVATGEVRVFTTDSLGHETELARLHEGTIFGEMALLSAQPRSASVQVVGEADLLEVTRESLRALAGELAQVARALHTFTRERLLRNLMATNALFRPFDSAQRRDLLRRFTSHDVAPGTHIIREGEPGAGLFVLLAGEVEVSDTALDGAPTLLATLRPGEVFGEMALLGGGPTTATVTTTRPATVLFLAREYVDRMVAGVPEIRRYLEGLAEDRRLDTQLARAAAGDDSEDAIIFI